MYSRFYVCMLALVVSIPNYATESREEIEIFEDSALYSRDKQVIFDQLININECRRGHLTSFYPHPDLQ